LTITLVRRLVLFDLINLYDYCRSYLVIADFEFHVIRYSDGF